MSKKPNPLIILLKEKLGLFLSISLGVFLFILFFQPFPLEELDFNNRLVFVAGLAGIVFLFMVLVRITFPWIIRNYDQTQTEPILPYYLRGFTMLVLSSVAFAFYLHYVGFVHISFHIMFKVVLICLAPPVVLWLYDSKKELKQQNESLKKKLETTQTQIEKYKEENLNKSIEFISETGSENLKLKLENVALIKSADNYVEIVYREGDRFYKKLIRNTLKNIEQQLKPYSNFIRCHRICIVNLVFIEKLNRKFNNHWLTIKDYDEQIPVSRQYLLKVKEAL
jgi:DNA-binding LytR/AlgR family response regulator